MATNKNALTRYLTLDRCFRNPGKDYTMAMLVEECTKALQEINPESTGVQRRQVYEDVKFMQDSLGYNAPIGTRKDGRFSYYFYDDRDFSITNQPINEQEAQQLKDTILTLSRLKGLPQFDWMEEMVTRLEQSFLLSSEEKVISFDENEFLTGREHISILYQAIINKQVLSISYQSFNSDEAHELIFHPYYLKEYNKRWFVFGINDAFADNVSNLALDRIKTLEKTNKSYIENSSIDFEEYFYDVIGVSVKSDAEVERVRIKVDVSLYPYIKTKPLHGSQKEKEVNDEYAIIELVLQLNYELESLLLGFGEKIEVLEPLGLRDKFRTHLKLGLDKYL